MARRIYIKDGGLNTSPTIPPGYTAIGTDSGELKKKVVDTISDIGGGGSSTTRVDVVSFGLKQGNIFTEDKANTNGLNNINNITTLLWEIVNSTGTKLITDTGFPNVAASDPSSFISTINTYVIDQNIDITVRGYYYIDDSKEKFRLVGRNAAYWSLVGRYNYGRMIGGRTIQPETIGQEIITALQEYGIPIGASGEGLMFTSQKSRSFGRPTVNPIALPSGKVIDQYYGIDSGDVPVPLSGETGIGYEWPNSPEGDIQYVECSRNGVVLPIVVFTDVQLRPVSLVEFSRITVKTNTYPVPNALRIWLVKPVGHDTILLSNNIDIQEDDEVFVIPERTGSIPYLFKVDIRSQIDDQGLGADLTLPGLSLKTTKDRFGNIRAEDIQFNKEYVRNKESIKYRVAYGKDGVYSVSQDYFKFIGNGRYIYALVNREH